MSVQASEPCPPSRPTFGEHLTRLIHNQSLGSCVVEVARHDVVYGCKVSDSSLYLVERGQVKAVAPSRDGKDCLLGIYIAGEVFGELCLDDGDSTETMVAMTPTLLRRVSGAKVVSALDDEGMREEFIKYLAHRLFEQQQLITDLVTADSEYRLAAILLHLGRKLGKRADHLLRIEERITQEELSEMVGTTRSRIGFFLKRFRIANLIAPSRGCFLVIDERTMLDYMIRGYAPKTEAPASRAVRGGRALRSSDTAPARSPAVRAGN